MNSSLPSDAEGMLTTFLGLGLVPLPAVIFVFSMPGEDLRTEPEVDGTEDLDFLLDAA